MRILFVCENYLPHYGGAEVVFKNLAEGFVKQGHKVSLITQKLKGTKSFEKINDVSVYRVKSLNSRYIFTFSSLFKVLKLARNHDVIQTTTFNGAFPSWFASKILNKPVCLTVHEVWVNKWNKVTNLNRFGCFVHNILEKLIYKLKFDKYVCVSNATKKDLLNLSISKNRVITIHNGLDYQFWHPKNFNGQKVLTILGLKNNFVCFSWGRPGPSKGFEYLIRAVPLIIKEIKNFKLVLMWGSKDKYPQQHKKLKQIIKELNIGPWVKIIPSLPYSELGNYISAADCVVIPSLAEGFGYNVVEAVALNKVIVASEVGSIPEVISGEYVLTKTKSPQSIAMGIKNVPLKKTIKTKKKMFPWDKAILSYLETYKELFNK
jgi:glycosyltransferase involved in cell wall biosynthesis